MESLREFKVGGMHKEEGSMVSELQVGDKILAINGQNAGESILKMRKNNNIFINNQINDTEDRASEVTRTWHRATFIIMVNNYYYLT